MTHITIEREVLERALKALWVTANPESEKAIFGIQQALAPTHPPQRTWVGLTDEDRYEFAAAQYSWEELLIATEAKLKEKNT